MNVLKALSVLVVSSLKYLLGLVYATTLFNFITSMLLTIAGGMAGVFFFAFVGKEINILWHKYILKRDHTKIRPSKYARFLVKIRRRFGLAGIALLTPPLLQVPVGTIIAMNLIKDFRKVSLYMLASFTFYSFVFCSLYYAF